MYNVYILYQLFSNQSIWEGHLLKKLFLYLFPALLLCYIVFLAGMYYGRQNPGAVSVSAASQAEVTVADNAMIDGKLNINVITVSQLRYIPGVGEKTAQRIIEYREQNGPFQALEDLDNVEGIGPKTVEQLSAYLCVGG